MAEDFSRNVPPEEVSIDDGLNQSQTGVEDDVITTKPVSPPPRYSTDSSFMSIKKANFTSKVSPFPGDVEANGDTFGNTPRFLANETGQPLQYVPKKTEKPSVRRVLLVECSENLAIPGIPNFFKAHNLSLKTFWLLANLVCWGLFGYVLYTMTVKYIAYPTVVNTDIQSDTNLEFPAVTVCNLNRVQAKRITKKSKFYGLTQLSRKVLMDVKKDSMTKLSGMSFVVLASSCDIAGSDSTEWLCNDKSNCIEIKRMCDGVYDCNDKSDESSCTPVNDTKPEEPKQKVQDLKVRS